MARTKINLSEGQWLRFSRYELRDGTVRPESGSTPTAYDPWARYTEAFRDSDAKTKTTPYLALLEAVADLSVDDRGRLAHPLRLTEVEASRDWCRQYGLLGVLLQRTLYVTLAPRWEFVSRAGGQAQPDDDDVHQLPVQLRYVRTGGGWTRVLSIIIPKNRSLLQATP